MLDAMKFFAQVLCIAHIVGSLRMDLQPSLSMDKEVPNNVYIRVQKTGSTSFGRAMAGMFSEHGQKISVNAHYDWTAITRRGLDHGHVFTILRDPVERYLSELMYIGWRPRQMLCQNMWDFQGHIYNDGKFDMLNGKVYNERRTAFTALINKPNDHNSKLKKWMNLAVPTRNRQLLYILGFDRIPCPTQGTSFCRKMTNETVLTDVTPLPTHKYDWDHDEVRILQKAKQRLGLIHFGLTECMNATIRSIALELGWDPKRAEEHVEMAKQTVVWNGTKFSDTESEKEKALHRMRGKEVDEFVKQEDGDDEYVDYLDYDPLVDSATQEIDSQFLEETTQLKLDRQSASRAEKPDVDAMCPSGNCKTYAEMFDPALIAKLRRHLRAEIKFYNWAVDEFNERHPHERCDAKKSELPSL